MQPSTIEVPAGLIKHGGKFWHPVRADGYVGFRPWRPAELQSINEITTLALGWEGGKIPIPMWREICAFFEAQFALTNGEAQLRLFYNPDTREWKAWAFPQEWSSGMTTKELEEHPDRAAQSEAIGAGFVVWGTVHHHCRGGAFQSGVDRDNEQAQNGLHITIGYMGSNKYDLDGRVYFAGEKYACDWAQWFEYDPCPSWVNSIPNLAERATVVTWISERFSDVLSVLKEPPAKTTDFPKVWIDNLIKKTWEPTGGGYYSGTYHGNGGGQNGHTFQGQAANQWRIQDWASEPSTYPFLNRVKMIVDTTPLPDEDVLRVLEEICKHGILTAAGRPIAEATFIEDFAKAAGDNHIYPRSAAGRLANQFIFPEVPIGDEEEILMCVYLLSQDAGFRYDEIVDQMGSLLMNSNAVGFGDAARSYIQYLRQLATKFQVSTQEVARIFFDYSSAQEYIEFKAVRDDKELDEEQLAIQEMNAEQRQIMEQHQEYFQNGGCD